MFQLTCNNSSLKSKIKINLLKNIYMCGPRISICSNAFPTRMAKLDFYLEKLVFYWLFENDLESPPIFVLFLKGKQNKKEKP